MFAGKRIIIFDLDGTLVDSVGVWNEVDRLVIKAIGGGAEPSETEIQKQRDAVMRLSSKADHPYLEYCKYLRGTYRADCTGEDILKLRYEIADDYLANTIDYKPGADKVLHRLKAHGFVLAMATTTRRKNLDIYLTANRNMMGKARLDECFSILYAREDTKEIKPNPEVYLRIMREQNAAPAECLIFEDSLIGIEAARNAGIEAVAMYDKYSDGEREAIQALADYQFANYDEVLAAIEAELLI
ncbi:HAD family phosphatase [Paenibacillus sp. YN15]|uniref:HAD family hydrolase n=1 Tax=Paenibacillus sp. YN15 TaxID=1742774 RepID=UPI000DCE54E6|nr:HAD family phosphatase [Paenibacillus sp. YN15]RAU93444.1 HAD family phosphatase [Paenibacillus sp. YN15]